MYRLLELGDCFLVTFTSGGSRSRMLIDCGSFRNTAGSTRRLDAITRAIAADLAGAPLDVVVGTHQHNDHLSGFVHCETTFRAMNIGQVWLSWLDNAADKRAQAIGKAHHNLVARLHACQRALQKSVSHTTASPTAVRSLEVLSDMLGFYGATAAAPPEIPAKAVAILKTLGARKPAYLSPGQVRDLPGLPAGSVRVYVLGPPRNDADLFRADPRKGESYDPALASANLLASRFLDAATNREGGAAGTRDDYPFNQRDRRTAESKRSEELSTLVKRYQTRSQAWRAIDDDWMQQAGTLALYLDTFTNNSSLVLAIELVSSGKVLLFAADAQSGNWASWANVVWEKSGVTTDDLLARTVFYKVGHHASHNATLVAALEKMTAPELVALIPVNKKDPNIVKPGGWKMPAKNLFNRLKEKTAHRVLQMDGVNPADCNPSAGQAKAAWKQIGIKPRVTDLAVEIDIH
jgi:beta-lactamase superfamily II metal-dependent hydrolase